MFNAVDRLPVVIEMIVAETAEQRQQALDRLLPIQRSDFRMLFETMSPLPVTIRLLDPPIHEFLPGEEQLKDDIEKLQSLKNTVEGLDVAHTGLAVRIDGRLHLLHAPLVGSDVVLSERPLADRIVEIGSQDGIMVARPGGTWFGEGG